MKTKLLLPPGDLSKRNRALLSLLPWRLVKITQLPPHYLRAIAVSYEGPALPPAELLANLGKRRVFGVALVPMHMMQLQVMNDPDRRIDFNQFLEYHDYFMRPSVEGKRVKRYPNKNRWPIFLSGRKRERETIVDGWHRFHSYVQSRARKVPVIWHADV